MKPEERKRSEVVAAAYDRGAATYAQSWSVPHPWMEEARREFGARLSAGMTLLDVGCGPGHDSNYWAGKGLTTLGIDVSGEALGVARRLYPSLEFHRVDVLDLGRLGRRFDAIWMSYCFLHIARAAAADVLDSIAASLASGGAFFLFTPIADSTQETLRPIAGLKDEAGREIEVPYTVWSIADLTALLGARFVVEWSQVSTPLPGRPSVWGAIMRGRSETH
jgi:2-polyprenyl-3-methyl-5-hydroxy-6-metoxy-1,4-benzoquinol methylase